MASYCIYCGHRQAEAKPQTCPRCGEFAPVFNLNDSSFGLLWQAAIKVAHEEISIGNFNWMRLAVSGGTFTAGWYDPRPPGTLALNLTRPSEEVCLELIHELGHALRHPVGSSDDIAEYQNNPHDEDSIVNAAADIACQQFAIPDYMQRLSTVGALHCVPVDQLEADSRTQARNLADQLVKLLELHTAR